MCRNSDDRSEAAARDLEAAGGSDAPIEIAAYDSAWPSRFAAEAERLQSNDGGRLGLLLHHIGSTAAPGLPAKPVIRHDGARR